MKTANVSKRALGVFSAGALLLLFAASATAQEERSQITVQGIGAIINNADNRGISQEATRSGGFLLGYSYRFHRWAGVEGNYGYARNSLRFSGGSGPLEVQSGIHQITGALVFHFPVESPVVKPYALAGTGVLVFDPTDVVRITPAGRQTRPAFLYGGGLNFDVARNVGIRAEYRGFVYKAPDFRIKTLDLNTFTHLAQPSVGVFFRF